MKTLSMAAPAPLVDFVCAVGIAAMAVVVAALAVRVFGRTSRDRLVLGVGAVLLMAASATAASSGYLARLDVAPPPAMVLMPAVLAIGAGIGVSRIGARAADAAPLAALIGLQAFRLPLELVMHRAGTLGIMPMELSYSGYNFDIVTGAGAGLLALALWRRLGAVPRAAVWAWNLWGIACLIAIGAIAVASSPVFQLFGDDPRHVNTWVLHFPYVWLPMVLVVVAIAGHVIVTRTLLRRLS